MVGERADAETVARLRKDLHLDEPILKQFTLYMGSVVRGDLGKSYITQRPIIRDIKERFPKTLLLAGTAMLLASVLGITIGVLSARNPGGWFDRLSLGFAYLGISFPFTGSG
jgi:ABC-type dipeptide/oligopeptide/nickel transport system permease component